MNSLLEIKARTIFMAIIVTCCIIFVAGCSVRKSDQYRHEADTLLRLGNLEQATNAYQRAVDVNPKNAAAIVGQGRCLAVKKKYDEAMLKFNAALAIDPSLEIAYQELINVMMAQNKVDEATKTAENFEAINEEKGGLARAVILRNNGRRQESAGLLNELQIKYPKSIDIRIALADEYLALRQPEKAENVLKSILNELDKNSIAARMTLINAYQAQGKVDQIVAEFEAIVKDNPDDQNLALGLARSYVLTERVDEAEEIAKSIYKDQPDSGWANYVLGACLLARNKYPDAVPYLQKAISILPDKQEVVSALAKARSTGKIQDPRNIPAPILNIPQKQVETPKVDKDWQQLWKQASLRTLLDNRDKFEGQDTKNLKETLVLAALISGQLTLAEELAGQLDPALPLHNYISALKERTLDSFISFMEKWQETEIDIERSVLRDNAYGFGLATLGARSRAVFVLSENLKTAPEYGVTLFNLARVFNAAGMPLPAARCMELLLAKAIDNIDAYTILYASLRNAGLNDKAQTVAEKAFNLFPTVPQAVLNLTQSYLDSKNYGLAAAALKTSIDNAPDNNIFRIALARLNLHSGKPAQAIEILENIIVSEELEQQKNITMAFSLVELENWQKAYELCSSLQMSSAGTATRLLAAATMVKTNLSKEATELFSEESFASANAGSSKSIILAALGIIPETESKGDNDFAKSLASDSESLAYYIHGLACVDVKLYSYALAAFKKAYDKKGGSPTLVALMMHCMTQALPKNERAERANILAEKHPEWVETWLAMAKVMHSIEDAQGEKKAIDKAAEIGPDRPEVWSAYGVFAEQQVSLRKTEIDNLMADKSVEWSNETQDAVNSIQVDQQNLWKDAVSSYRKLVEIVPESVIANNNLAYTLLMTDGDMDEALKRAEIARQKMPNDPSVLHTLGAIQLRKGNLEESKKYLAVALEMKPGEPTLLLDYGKMLIKEGKTLEGKNHIELARKYSEQLGLDFPRKLEAIKLLRGYSRDSSK